MISNDFGYLKQLDIRKGDLLVVSSDITSFLLEGFRETGTYPDVNILIDALFDTIGEDGTLVFPTFNWDFCSGHTFDWRSTEGKVGLLGNVALKRSDFLRTKHPLYSFVVKGKYQKELCEIGNIDSFGLDSPFAFFYNHGAKALLYGISLQEGYTFAHFVEQVGNAPYRYSKFFSSIYIDESGREEKRTFSMYVRDLSLDVIADFHEMEKELLEKGIAKQTIIDEVSYIVIDMRASFEIILNDVKNNRSRKICKYIGQND